MRLAERPELRALVLHLLAQGWSARRIAKAAGIGHDAVYEIKNGHGRKQRKRGIPHGTVSSYKNHGCRCKRCRLAARHYNQHQRRDPRNVPFIDTLPKASIFSDPTGEQAVANIEREARHA